MNHDLTRILCASLLALCMTNAFAAPSTPEPQDKLDAVRVQIAAKVSMTPAAPNGTT